jgi:hypothetical protein
MVGGLTTLVAVGVLVYLLSGCKVWSVFDRHARKECRGTRQVSTACSGRRQPGDRAGSPGGARRVEICEASGGQECLSVWC